MSRNVELCSEAIEIDKQRKRTSFFDWLKLKIRENIAIEADIKKNLPKKENKVERKE